MTDHPDLVVLRTFLNDIDAQLARTALEAAEIDSMIRADDAGGMRPHLWVGSGVELVVRAQDVERANQILDDESAAVTDDE